MTGNLSEANIVKALARETAQRITRRVRTDMQKMPDTTSGDDSGLKTVWEEFCVQIQLEASIFWDAYVETVRCLIEYYVSELPSYQREALWLQTEDGWEWDCQDSEERDNYPVCTDTIVDYLMSDYVYDEAERWSNKRIRAYIERSSMRD